jgi:putative transposase
MECTSSQVQFINGLGVPRDVFTRKDYIDILLDSLRFCQQEKGLKIYAWVVMRNAAQTNHIHLIVQSDKVPLSDIIRDFKRTGVPEVYSNGYYKSHS